MKKTLFLATLLSFATATGFALSACDDSEDDVCVKAAKILKNDCGLDDNGGGGGGDSKCEGTAAATAQCYVDYPDQACLLFSDPLNTDAYADLSQCVLDASS